MGIFELNLTMPEDFLLLAIIPSELYVFGHIFGRSKSYRKPLPSRCSSQLELSGTLSPISGLFYSGGGEKIHFQAQSACIFKSPQWRQGLNSRTRPCRLERVHTPTAHLFRKCSNGAFCTSKQHISQRRNARVRPQTRGGRPHRSGARPTARPQQQQQHQHPQHQQQTAAQQQHYKFARSEHHNLGRRGANSSR